MQSLMAHFRNVFDYIFNAEWNPEYANAAHIKISPSTDARYPNEIRITAIDSDGEIHSICAYDADLALEPMSVEYEPLEDEIDESDEEAALGYPNCPNCADQASIAAPGQTTLCKTHEIRKPLIEVLANQNKFWTSHIEHTHCENCHNQPYQILYISSNFTPLHLCLQCGIKFDSLLNA